MNQRMADFSPVLDGDPSHAPAGLFMAVVSADHAPLAFQTIVAPLAPAEISRVLETAVELLQRHGPTVTVEVTCIESQMAANCLRPLKSSGEIRVKLRMLEPTEPRGGGTEQTATSPGIGDGPNSTNLGGQDPFGMRGELRSKLAMLGRFLFARQALARVRGRDFLPQRGSAIILGTTQAPLCWSALVLAVAFDASDATHRPLRVLYDKQTATVPGVGALLNSLGAVPSGAANARTLLERGEVVCMLFSQPRSPEPGGRSHEATSFGLAAARLSLLTDSAIIPAAIRTIRAPTDLSALLAQACRTFKDAKPADALRHLGTRLSVLVSPCRLEINFFPPVNAPSASEKSIEAVATEIADRIQNLIE